VALRSARVDFIVHHALHSILVGVESREE
jgi:hypothetical protein